MSSRLSVHPVSERRLRPIYDALDNGNNKKALQEADKVLKKQPDLQCAKALKCLAMLRLGKESDSIKELEIIKNECPTEESTLQAMVAFYREVHQPQSICELYENVNAKRPHHEEILNNLFLSYVRVGDYKKQQLIAMNLNKVKPSNQYYFWAIISILLQAVDDINDLIHYCLVPRNKAVKHTLNPGEIDETKAVGLKLAEKMMEKFISENKIQSEQEALVYLIILEMRGKTEEALKVLDGPLASNLEQNTVLNKKIDLLSQLNRWSELNSLIDGMLRKDSDCWHCYLYYLDSIFHEKSSEDFNLKLSKARDLFQKLIKEQEEAVFKKRGPFLAMLELHSRLREHNIEAGPILGNPLDHFRNYFETFGTKQCSTQDLQPYVCGFYDLLVELTKEQEDRQVVAESRASLNLLVCQCELRRILSVKSFQLTTNEKKEMIKKHIKFYIEAMPLVSDLPSTESSSGDRLALIAVHVLFELYTDSYKTSYIFEAIALCHFVLSYSPSNSQFKLLLVKLYHLVGATEGAHSAYTELEIKHMQLDTLGYFHVFPLLSQGSYSHASSLLNSTLKFFTYNTRESADHITYAYKYEALSKIPEFIGIKEKLNNSTHFQQCVIDKMLLEVFASNSYSNTIQILEEMDVRVNVNRIKWDRLQDNRDFTVLWDIEPPNRRLSNEVIIQSYGHDIVLLNLRSLLLLSISSVIELSKSDSVNYVEFDETVEIPEKVNLVQAISRIETTKPMKSNVTSPIIQIAGPPLSRLIPILQVNYFDLVLNQLRFVKNFLPGDSTHSDKCQYLFGAIFLFIEEFTNKLILSIPSMDISSTEDLKYYTEKMSMLSLFAELISFSCITLSACETILCKIKSNLLKKNKKKRDIKIPVQPSLEYKWRANLINNFLTFLNDSINKVVSHFKLVTVKPIVISLSQTSCTFLYPSDIKDDDSNIRNRLEEMVKLTCSNICESHADCITQISNLLNQKLKWISSIKV